ncbi:MAG: dihydrofolate reductase [Rhodocyclaceae bacterium]|nr:dihydrofolate reductase [Rhodocyclaceae bacterium]MDZ4215746.1 dihydrofolate reductase [Rhodocyclaceae bacterium]
MMTLIAAVARNGVIGKDNALPWHLPEDLKHFKQLTTGQAVIMGRKTWESLPERFRPLPGRDNIVVTRNAGFDAPGATVAHTLGAALQKVGAGKTAYLIGGAELYGHALPIAQRLELTEIDADIDGDACFPAFDRSAWQEVGREAGTSADGLGYAFVTYERT